MRKRKLWLYICFWVILIAAVTVAVAIQRRQKELYAARITELNGQLAASNEKKARLQAKLDFNKSAKYAEDYAHDELGLAYPDELIFVDDSY